MQTFLPYESFIESAKCLDNKRLGKQRVEAKQILIALGVDVGQHRGNSSSSWRSHPCTKMWRGYEVSLAKYGRAICDEWIARGYKDTLCEQFDAICSQGGSDLDRPFWLGAESLHASHRSNLLRKDAKHYGSLGWNELPDMEYVWPVA